MKKLFERYRKSVWMPAVAGILIGLVVCLPSGFASQELAEKSRPATQPDMIGLWKMTYQKVSPSIKTDPIFFAENQIWLFMEDGYVKNIGSTHESDASMTKILLEPMPKVTKFSFVKEGVLKIERGPNDMDVIVISLITADLSAPLWDSAPLLKKGDLILAYLASEKQVYMQRFLRRGEVDEKKESQ